MEAICNQCERRDIVSQLTHWCSDCEDGLCGKCLKDHKAMKLTQNHHVTEMTEISVEKSKLLTTPQCNKHPDCREDFLCLDHDLICCHACIKSDHQKCQNVSNVNVLSKGVSKSELFLYNKRTVQKVRESLKEIIEERQSVKEDVTKQQQRIRMEIANTKSKFMEHINNIEKILLQELLNIEKENKNLVDEEMGQLLQTDKEIEEEAKTMQFIADNGSESRLFTFLKKQRTKKDYIFKKIKDIQHTSRIKISLEEASHEIKAIKAIGFLSVHYEMVKSRRPDIPLISKHGLNDLAQTVSNQSTQNTSSIARIPKFPMMKEALQIKLDPKDFVDRNDKYAKLNLRKVWIAVNDGNCLFVAGHVTILEEHTEKNEYSKYKNNYRLVKYVYNDKGLTFINGWNICCDQYYRNSFNPPSMNIAFSCIPKSAQAVLLHDNNFNLIDTETMERQWCLKLDHQFEALATDEKFIYISTKGLLYKYNCIGFLVERINFIHCDSFALSLNGNFACHSDIFRLLRDDGSEIFSYHPVGLKTVTADKTGNIYLATEDGIQLIDLLKMETAMVFRYEKEMWDGLMGVVCNRDENLQFLHGKMSDKSEEFGQYLEERDISGNMNSSGYYLCDKCNHKSQRCHCYYGCKEAKKRCVNFWKFTVHILTK